MVILLPIREEGNRINSIENAYKFINTYPLSIIVITIALAAIAQFIANIIALFLFGAGCIFVVAFSERIFTSLFLYYAVRNIEWRTSSDVRNAIHISQERMFDLEERDINPNNIGRIIEEELGPHEIHLWDRINFLGNMV